jgi:hypothetical protein
MNTYAEFKQQSTSEKITLAVINAAKRLIAFTLHSGSVYKITSFDMAVIDSISDSGVTLTAVSNLASVVAGSFYNDRENQTLYIQTSDSANPNTKFLHMVRKLYFASAPVTAPYDLSTGFDVYWEPSIKSTSDFGVEIDTVNQQNEAIEGSGTLSLYNDNVFWSANFDKLFFENQPVSIYSWSRDLPISEASLLFKGKIESKSWSTTTITFKMKDLLSVLKNAVQLSDISELSLRNNPSLNTAKQRMVIGRVFGHRPINLDEVINYRYPITGTLSTTTSSATVTGSGTLFLTELSPDDRLDLDGVEYTIASITSDTSLELSETFSEAGLSGYSADFLPATPKRFINRVWNIAGHALREPTTTIQVGSSTSRLFLGTTEDMYTGDELYIGTLGSGELVTISEVLNDTTVTLSTSLTSTPGTGTTVTRPCIQQVKIDDTDLVFYRDYTVDASTATLTLRNNAETNAASIRESVEQGTFTNSSRTVTGSGTYFKSFLKPGHNIRPKGTVDFYEILSVDSDTQITLRSAPSGLSPNPTTAVIQYQSLVFNPSEHVLHCEVLGRTDDDTSSGSLLKQAPEIVKQLLIDAGVSLTEINTSAFTTAQERLPEEISFVIPQSYNSKAAITYRDILNNVNKSVLGIVFQDSSFKISYDVLRPVVANTTVFRESDCLSLSVQSTNKNMVKTVNVDYAFKEYDYTIEQSNISRASKTSDISTYILQTEKEKNITTVLINESDAQRLANRWAFLLEFSSNSVIIHTKMQASSLQINDMIDVQHRKLFDRFGGTSKRKIMAVEKITKSGTGCLIEAVDLSNAFNRIGLITDIETDWENTNEDNRLISGFITDANGLINNEENSFYSNLIW